MIVALLTDFGTRDHYVGTMKGVVLGVCPAATLVDITHHIAPQDVRGAALELDAAFPYFPPRTVFLVVVDPGVGSTRRGLAADAGGSRFVGPDNGVLSLALARGAPRIVSLTEAKYARPTVSRTFEGRDRFAPAAGWLARGVKLSDLGPAVTDPVSLDIPAPSATADGIAGEVLRVDRFGNLITNITADLVVGLQRPTVAIAGREVPMVTTYADASPGELCALIGSSGRLEVAANGGSAAEVLAMGITATVRIRGAEA